MISIKRFSDSVTMEPFFHKAPLEASVPLSHFGKCCFNPTSDQKSKPNYKLHENEDFCLYHSLLHSQHTVDAQYILGE